jgi:O-antigen/teichoic acid export membrane protein
MAMRVAGSLFVEAFSRCYDFGMPRHMKQLAKQSFIYTIGSVAQSAVAILLIPLYTRYLGPTDYGALEITNTALSVLLFSLSFGFASSILKYYSLDLQNDAGQQKKLIGTAFLSLVPVVLLCESVLFLCARPLAQFLFGDPNLFVYIQILIATSFFAILLNQGFAVLRAQEDSKKYTLVFLARFLALLVFNVAAVVVFKAGLKGILIGNMLTYIIACLMLVPTLLRSASFTFDVGLLKLLLAFGIPLVPASMAQWFMVLSDRYFLRTFRSLTEVGIYSLGYKIGFLVMILLVTPFQLAWPTISFRAASAKDQDHRELYAKSLTYFVLVGLAMMIPLSLFAHDLIVLFSNKSFVRGADVVWIVALSYIFYGAHFVVSTGIHLAKKTKLYPWLVVIPALLNVVLNYFLIKPFGMMGAAYATLASFVVMFACAYVVSNYFYPVAYEWKRIGLLVALTTAALSAGQFVPVGNLAISIVLKCIIIVAVAVILVLFGFFDAKEIAMARSLIGTFRNKKQEARS